MLTDTVRGKFEERLRQLLINGVKREAPNILGAPETLPAEDSLVLLSIAAQLALSGNRGDIRLAYEVVALVLELLETPQALALGAADVILARLGNFPARSLTRSRFTQTGESMITGGAALALESIARESENAVEIRQREVVLTDFQRRLFDALDRWNSVSISAPTSAGKSFLLSLDVIRHHVRRKKGAIVFVVPTRALIRQVMRDVIERLREFGTPEVTVLCVPEAASSELLENGLVYVLTQERLINLIATHGADLPISLLIIDEAQELGDAGRGIILQSAIERTLRLHPLVRVLFASPLRSNPGFLLTLFGRTEQGEFFVERSSPVSQNIVIVSPVPRKPQRADFHLLRDNERIAIGQVGLPFTFREPRRRLLANFAVHLTQPSDSTIIYVNEPSEAETVASEISELVEPMIEVDVRVRELMQFLRDNVHPSYPLIECLKHGVAFHYGYMPEIIRMAIEDLVRSGAVRFVCCTSTLLQGVNLPAKNVVIYRPTRGRGQPMDKGAFWNLAGRAGRLMREYTGNVWCIAPDNWDENPLEGERLVEISATFRDTLLFHTDEVLASANATERPAENDSTAVADQTFAKVFSDFTLQQQPISQSSFCNEANRDVCERLDDSCQQTVSALQTPHEILERHNTVSPFRIEELSRLFHTVNSVEDLIPLHPRRTAALQRLREIFRIMETVFFKSGNRSYMYFASLAHFWMTGTTLGELIAKKLAYEQIPDEPRRVTRAVRDLLEAIEKILRYKYVKYLRLYTDVLASHLNQTGHQDLLPGIAPLHLYIEYGACDDVLLHLMGFGLSRASAIALQRQAQLPTDAEWEDCRRLVEDSDVVKLQLPALVKREVSMIRHRT